MVTYTAVRLGLSHTTFSQADAAVIRTDADGITTVIAIASSITHAQAIVAALNGA